MDIHNILCLYINDFFVKYSRYRNAIKRIAEIVATSCYDRIFYRSGEVLRIVNIISICNSLHWYYHDDNCTIILANVCATHMCNVSNY